MARIALHACVHVLYLCHAQSELRKQVEGAGADAGLPAALAAAVRPHALAEFEKCLSAVFSAGAEVSP